MYSAAIGLGLLGLLFLGVSAGMRGEGLSRNRAIGIRTRATMASDAAWSRGHKAAAPWVLSTGILAIFMAVAALVLTWSLGDELSGGISGVFVCVAFGSVIGLVAVSARVANVAARDVH